MTLEGPNFQNFTKEVIQNPLAQNAHQKFDLVTHINREDFNIQDLFINRTKTNLGTPIFQIIAQTSFDKKKLADILSYIKTLTRCEQKHLQLNIGDTYSRDKFKKEAMYIIDTRGGELKDREIFGEAVLNIQLRDIIEVSGGLIYITDNVRKMPALISTMSQLVFVDQEKMDEREIEEVLKATSLLYYKTRIQVQIDFLTINKLSLWTKISNFNKFS